MDPHTQRAEAERWLGIAAKLLTARDFVGSKTFAIRAREADPNNTVVEEILSVVETILASEKRVKISQQQLQQPPHQHQQQSQPDWYAVLQLPRLVRDAEVITEHYRRLVMCLNPERNRFPFADYALQLVMEAWGVLSDPTKKWLFDNQLALYLQQQVGAGGGGSEVNTFQFFQPQPQPQQQSIWQQQPQNQQQMMNQREFISLQSQPAPPQQVVPQWKMRDPTRTSGVVGGGEKNKGVMDEIGEVTRGVNSGVTPISPPSIQPGMPRGSPSQPPLLMARVAATTRVRGVGVDGNVGNSTANVTGFNSNNNNNNNNIRIDNYRVNDNDNGNGNGNDKDGGNKNVVDNDEVVVDKVDCFWTACPYCFYIFEYLKIYQDCALRCQNCRRGFHAVQIPNPPPIASKGGVKDGNGNGKGKEKGDSFCCWGFFPLGFSTMEWKKQNRIGNSSWVPFTPMFTCPVEGGGEGFKWFDNGGGNAFVGPKNGPKKYSPRVYIDDEEDLVDVSEPSDLDSSDGDWRTAKQEKSKKKKRKNTSFGGRKRGRPRVDNGLKSVTRHVASGGGVSVGGEEMDDGSDAQVVVGLAAGDKSDARRTVSAALARKLGRRSVKDVGRLDLNVEFNNDGEDHAPTVTAVNGEEERFFDGLEEFLKSLPILDVGGDEKARPS